MSPVTKANFQGICGPRMRGWDGLHSTFGAIPTSGQTLGWSLCSRQKSKAGNRLKSVGFP